MNTSTPKQPLPSPVNKGLSAFARALIGGMLVFFATGAFVFLYPLLFHRDIEDGKTRSFFAKAEAVFAQKAAQNGVWAEAIAQRVRGANKKQALELLAFFTTQLPELRLTFYDVEGKPLDNKKAPPSTPGEGAAKAPSLVKRALYGAWGYGFSDEEGTLALTAVAPTGFLRTAGLKSSVVDESPGSLGVVRVVAVATLLHPPTLNAFGEELNADISVLTLEELLKESRFRDAGVEKKAVVFSIWEGFENIMHKPQTLVTTTGNKAVAGPLFDSVGAVNAALVVVPLAQDPFVFPLKLLLAIAAGAGAVTALFLGWGVRKDALTALEVPDGQQGQAGIHTADDGSMAQDMAFSAVPEAPAGPQAPSQEVCFETLAQGADLHLSGRFAYQRYFDFAPYGAFQATTSGVLLHVNQQFASLLGFESAGHLLTNRENLCDFVMQPEEGQRMLRQLQEAPGMRHEVFFSLRGGGVKALWIITIATGGTDECPTMEGFLIDRSPDILLEQCYREYTEAMEERSSLALLLASTSRQFQSYILGERRASAVDTPFPDRRGVASRGSAQESAPAEPDLLAPLCGGGERTAERRQGAFLLKTVFDDIYQIAIDEAEVVTVGIAPVNPHALMEQLYSQVFPVMRARGMALHTELDDNLVARLSCSAALLRHVLLRALLVVTEGMQGGSAHVSLRKNGENLTAEGVFELVCSISWEAGAAEAEDVQHDAPADEAGAVPPDSAPHPQEEAGKAAGESTDGLELPALSRSDEFHVIRFLVHKLGGELIEGAQTRESRSLKIIMHFQCIEAGTAQICALQQDETATGQQGMASAEGTQARRASEARAEGLKKQAMTLAEENLDIGRALSMANLDLIVMDDILEEGSFESPEAAKKQILDILLVEDSLNNRLLFSLYLRDTPHRITEARNGEEGVELFREKQFDIIFMDMEMPLMDGYQATRIIRALEADEHRIATPIVAQTAHVLPEFKQQCVQAGCSGFLSKPFSKNALLTMLDAVAQLKYAS